MVMTFVCVQRGCMCVFMYVHTCVHTRAEVNNECLPQGLFQNLELVGPLSSRDLPIPAPPSTGVTYVPWTLTWI